MTQIYKHIEPTFTQTEPAYRYIQCPIITHYCEFSESKKAYSNKNHKRGRFPGTMGSRSKKMEPTPTDGRGHESSGPELQDTVEYSKTEPAICELSSIRVLRAAGHRPFSERTQRATRTAYAARMIMLTIILKIFSEKSNKLSLFRVGDGRRWMGLIESIIEMVLGNLLFQIAGFVAGIRFE